MQYISAWQALNIPNKNGQIADWHPEAFFTNFVPNKFYKLTKNHPLGTRGIEKRFVPFLQKSYFVANFARAIADLVYFEESRDREGCVREFLNEEEKNELFEYLKIIAQTKDISAFLKSELPIHFLKEKSKNAQNLSA